MSEQHQDSFGSGASEAPAARSAESRSLFTPGPWSYEMPDEVVVRAPDGGRLAQLSFLRGRHGTLGRRDTDEVIANARLIAAATDLLEAAEAALAYDAEIQGCANDPDRMASHCTAQGQTLDDLYERWIALSRAALAKAGVKP
jgi:hypothetical protein